MKHTIGLFLFFFLSPVLGSGGATASSSSAAAAAATSSTTASSSTTTTTTTKNNHNHHLRGLNEEDSSEHGTFYMVYVNGNTGKSIDTIEITKDKCFSAAKEGDYLNVKYEFDPNDLYNENDLESSPLTYKDLMVDFKYNDNEGGNYRREYHIPYYIGGDFKQKIKEWHYNIDADYQKHKVVANILRRDNSEHIANQDITFFIKETCGYDTSEGDCVANNEETDICTSTTCCEGTHCLPLGDGSSGTYVCTNEDTCSVVAEDCTVNGSGEDDCCYGYTCWSDDKCCITMDSNLNCATDTDCCTYPQHVCGENDFKCCVDLGYACFENTPSTCCDNYICSNETGNSNYCCVAKGESCYGDLDCCGPQQDSPFTAAIYGCQNNLCCTSSGEVCATDDECCPNSKCENERCCTGAGGRCKQNVDCCRGNNLYCNDGFCAISSFDPVTCTTAQDCSAPESQNCVNNQCCSEVGFACSAYWDCCQYDCNGDYCYGTCENGLCCAGSFNTCYSDDDCCGDSTCLLDKNSCCGNHGDICETNEDCCEGICCWWLQITKTCESTIKCIFR